MSRLLMAGVCACLVGCGLLSEPPVDRDQDGFSSDEDCDDSDPNVHPGAPELCDEVDQDCDGAVADPDAIDAAVYHPDMDNDGRGDPDGAVTSCVQPEGHVVDGTDCDDTTPRVSPDVAEICDGLDNDCDLQIDEPDATNAPTWHLDRDEDGFGDPEEPGITACEGAPDHADNGDDCDDTDPKVHPDADETWYDGLDQDCDGWSDFDQDRDGHDSEDHGGTDCEDTDSEVSPDAEEICNDGIDNDCDGTTNGCGIHGEIGLGLAHTQITGEDSRDQIGSAIAAAGDVNGDGYVDLLVDAPYSDLGGDNAGAVYLVAGPLPEGEIGLELALGVVIGEEVEDRLGTVLAGVGDLDGDGLDDLVLTSVLHSEGSIYGGAVYLFLGPLSGTLGAAEADARVLGPSDGLLLGYDVSAVTDQDGDGAPDLLLGMPGHQMARGGAILVSGTILGEVDLDTASLAVIEGEAEGDGLGAAFAAVDLDGDGVTELLLGAPGRAPSGTDATGVAYGISLPLPASAADADWRILGQSDGDLLGNQVMGVGDLDGDGLDDVLIGANATDGVANNTGAAHLFLGELDGPILAEEADVLFLGMAEEDGLGRVMAAPGDLDGDGIPDLVFGLPSHSPDEILSPRAGRVLVFSGDLRGVVDSEVDAEAWIDGESSNDEAGTALTSLGDADGDGYIDLLISAPYQDTAGPNAGAVYLMSGGGI